MKHRNALSFVLVLSLLFISNAFAKKVDLNTAKRAGTNFYYERINGHQNVPYSQLNVQTSFTIKYNGSSVYYVFDFDPEGYVIVSAEDAVTPVLGYSFDGKYSEESKPPQFINWMEGYAKQIDYSVQNHLTAEDGVKSEWDHLLTSNPGTLTPLRTTLDVAPLLLSTWDQGANYNDLCPVDMAGPGGHVWAGCVATAMCQVMYYYRWPNNGNGYHCYVPSGYPQQCADFTNTNYDWYRMLNSITTHDTSIATLLWHAGVSVDMMYSPNGSGAYSEDAANALRTNFKYHPNTQLLYKDNYSQSTWEQIIRDNLDNKRPMYYDGYGSGGHAFNLDGYQGTSYFHFNWGWSGSYNGYFYLSNLNPGGNNFTNGQGAIVNCYPDTTVYTYPAYCSGQVILTAFSGTFEDGSGPLKDYHNNADCGWLIHPQSPSDSVDYITITFNRFNTEAGNDFVKIYAGESTSDSLVATLSGDNIPPSVVVHNSKALIKFTTNNSTTKSGFYITYVAHSMDWCLGTTTLTANEGAVSDGSLNYNYKNRTTCRWKIFPDNNGPVTLTFTSFKTEPNVDVVQVYDYGTEQLLGRFSGDYNTSSLPGPVIATSGKMFVMFTTNLTVNDQGWEGYYTTYPVGITDLTGNSTLNVFPNPAKDFLTIHMYNKEKQLFRIELIGTDGKSLLIQKIEYPVGVDEKQVSLNGIPAGVYFLRLISDQQTITRKVVIE